MDNKENNGLNIDNLMNGLNDPNNNLNNVSNDNSLNSLNQNAVNGAPIINNQNNNVVPNMNGVVENNLNNQNSQVVNTPLNGVADNNITPNIAPTLANEIPNNNINNTVNNGIITDVPINVQPINTTPNVSPVPQNNQVADQNIKPPIIDNPNLPNDVNNSVVSGAPTNEPTPVSNNFNNDIKIESVPTNDIKIEEPVSNNTQNSSPISNVSTPEVTLSDPTVDNFASVPVPPESTDDKGKKKHKGEKGKSNKLIVILLVLVLIAIVGYGVYYFLGLEKPKTSSASIQTKDLRLELGAELSKNINDYATITGFEPSSCILDTSKVDTSKVSAYKYNITCNQTKQEGTIIIDDTEAPVVSLTDVYVTPNSKIEPSDFIESCVDASTCSYEFANEEEVMTNLASIGEYKVKIIITDSYDNEVEEEGSLTVSLNAPTKYLTCEGEDEAVESIYANSKTNYKFGLDASGTLFNANKTTVLSFDTDEDYKSVKDSFSESKGINGIIGKTTFNDKNRIITIVTKETLEEVGKDLNTTLPNDGSSLSTFLTFYNYTCN